ncbi:MULTISPECIES: hypothetical protein [Bradyrhizobium]|uniref:Uncharacterized protein n=1 Tax=Bradyrhizobium elkanii TaxID=29448 RepID=A0A8I1Y6T6_BRAEL|nr:hypothetical protein [Bradyrhizobium elkanii]MBP1294310.1 hypothetical protein [Bradyrhizobium elkanii]
MSYRIMTTNGDIAVPNTAFCTFDRADVHAVAILDRVGANMDELYILDEATGIEHRWTAVDAYGNGGEQYIILPEFGRERGL